MKPARFELLRPTTIAEATAALAESPDDTVILAGGQSLVPLMNMRFVVAERVLDLNAVEELSYLRRDNGHLAVGAMTRHRAAELDELVAAHCPLIADAEQHVGYVSVRNRGTIGGSIAHADTVAEMTCVAVALDATVVLQSARGRRDVAISDFLAANLINSREPDEIVTEIRFPVSTPATATGFAEFARKTGDFPLVTAAVRFEHDGGSARDVRVAVGGVAPTPIRLAECEGLLEGAAVSGDLLDEVARTAAALVEPTETPFVSVDYRRHLAGVVVRRALDRALESTGQEGSAS